jgi:hypothetical protein
MEYGPVTICCLILEHLLAALTFNTLNTISLTWTNLELCVSSHRCDAMLIEIGSL